MTNQTPEESNSPSTSAVPDQAPIDSAVTTSEANPVESPSQPNPAPTYDSFSTQPSNQSLQEVLDNSRLNQKPAGFLVPIIFSIVFIFLVGILGTGGYAVAYQKIELPEKYQAVQFVVTDFVQSLPFMPKTPQFLLAKSILAQDQINKESYDVSLAIDQPNENIIPGLGTNFDLQAKGAIDYSNKDDIKFTLDADITKDFSVKLIKPDNFLYFSITKVPSLLLSAVGMKASEFDPIITKWFHYDTTPLETEARRDINEKSGDRQVISDRFVKDNLDKYVDERILSEIKITTGSVDGFPVHKLTIRADSDLIDYIGKIINEDAKKNNGSSLDYMYPGSSEKMSEIIKSMNWEVDIDKKTYYVRKISIVSEVEVDEIDSYGALLGTSSLTSPTTKLNFAITAKFSDFGKDISINKPEGSKSWEEFTEEIAEIVKRQYQSSSTNPDAFAKARDAKRLSDIQTLRSALEIFYSECGVYPESLSDLNNPGPDDCPQGNTINIVIIPNDPYGYSYYYSSKNQQREYDLCALLEANSDKWSDSCPEDDYNYHVSNP